MVGLVMSTLAMAALFAFANHYEGVSGSPR
jgi:hypothetical protein